MKILYGCSFDLSLLSGKERATSQKLKELGKLVDVLDIMSLKSKKTIIQFFELVIVEFKLISYLLFKRPDVFISRGYTGNFSIRIAKLIGILTVREVHADIIGELSQVKKSLVKHTLTMFLAKLSVDSDKLADIRIFNHPYLQNWYKNKYKGSCRDFYVYNGFDYGSTSKSSTSAARARFGLSNTTKYLVFTGAASYWHGVDYLVGLQNVFIDRKLDIQIICGGGKVSSELDSGSVLLNFHPLDESGCAELISAADMCLLPVKESRVSPGSPLKLYDYILQRKFVISQDFLPGYSDEVLAYGFGCVVDFRESESAADVIESYLDSGHCVSDCLSVDISRFSWHARVTEWLIHFEKSLKEMK